MKLLIPKPVEAVAPSASAKRLLCYLAIGLGGYIGGIQNPPHTPWGWVLFVSGLAVSWGTVYRAFLDQTLSKQVPQEDAPAPQAITRVTGEAN